MALETVRLRRGTAAAWAAANPILSIGEPGWETDTLRGKVGDGATLYNTLPYSLGSITDALRFAPKSTTAVATGAAGAICFTWDDGWSVWDDLIPFATGLGQRHTFAVTSDKINAIGGVSTGTLLSMVAGNHEVSAHSKTHTKINSSLAAATRLVEYETPRTAIEAIIGAGKVKTWTWPFGTASSPAGRDDTVDREVYLRYDRALDTAGASSGAGVHLRGDGPRFNIPRVNWTPDTGGNTEAIRELVRMAATSPVVVAIYSHNFTDPGTGWNNVQSVLQTAAVLGIPCITAAEAFPAEPFNLPDPGFENGTLVWDYTGDGTTSSGVANKTTRALDVNMPGSWSAFLTATTTTSTPFLSVDAPVKEGVNYTFSGRYFLTASTGGAGPKLYAGIQYYDTYGTPIGASNDTATLHGTVGSWGRFTIAATAPALARIARVKLVLQQIQATVYWDHTHFGPTTFGSYG